MLEWTILEGLCVGLVRLCLVLTGFLQVLEETQSVYDNSESDSETYWGEESEPESGEDVRQSGPGFHAAWKSDRR